MESYTFGRQVREKLVLFLEYILRYNVIMPLPFYPCPSKTSYVPTWSLPKSWPFKIVVICVYYTLSVYIWCLCICFTYIVINILFNYYKYNIYYICMSVIYTCICMLSAYIHKPSSKLLYHCLHVYVFRNGYFIV